MSEVKAEIQIGYYIFKSLINSAKLSVGDNFCRDGLQYIRMHVNNSQLIVQSCNGYQGIRLNYTLQEEYKDISDVDFWLKPISFPKRAPSETAFITIQLVEIDSIRYTRISIPVVYGNIIYEFTEPNVRFFDITDVIEKAKQDTHYKASLDMNKLGLTASAFKVFDPTSFNCTRMYTGEPTTPILFTSKTGDDISVEYVLLPVRDISEDR